PTHPVLLDWLATELVRSGWSTKHIHRLIVCSHTYRQSSESHPENAKRNPDNTLWRHFAPRRLEAELIRDNILAVSGELDRTLGGPGMPETAGNRRRSLYLWQERDNPPSLQGTFDGPCAASESCACRHVSTVPLQSLYLLNSKFAFDQAKAFANSVIAQAGNHRMGQVETSFRLALGRPPTAAEREAAEQFFEVRKTKDDAKVEPSLSLVHFCQIVLNL